MINTTPSNGAIRVGNWKLVLNGGRGASDGEDEPAAAKGRAAESIELFDLAADVGEKQNRAADRPEVVAKLRARYDAYAAEAVPPKAAPKPRGFKNPRVWGQAD